MKNEIKFTPLIILLAFLGCNNESKIEGYWHIKRSESDRDYFTINIQNEKDSIAYCEKYTFNPYSIRHNLKNKNLITGDCGGFFEYSFNIDGKKIFLKNVQDYGDFVGNKYELTNSQVLKDYEKDLFINISYPRNENLKIESITFKQELLIESIIIGKPKYSKDIFFKDKIRIQVRDKFLELEDVNDFIEDVESRYTDEELKILKFRFVCDKNVTVKFINQVLEKLKEKGFEKNYLTCLKEKPKKIGDIFNYIHLNDLDLSTDTKISDLLK